MSQHIISLTLVTKPGGHNWASAYNLLSTVALDNGQDFAMVTVSSQDMEDELELDGDLEEVEEFHDENTMAKVYEAIKKGLLPGNINFTDEEEATSIITALQNAGILFREIRK